MEITTLGNTMNFKITSGFKALEPFRKHPHTGIDINFPNGTDVHSVMDGTVDQVTQMNESLGNAVSVKFEDGTTGIYAHLSDVTVKEGQTIHQGDLLGFSGNTGHVVGENGGYHLHFALKDGSSYVDPTGYANDLMSMSSEPVVGIGQKLLDKYNAFADKVVGAETDFVLQPLWDYIRNGAIELCHVITIYLPDIMMIVTCIAAMLIMFGVKIPKVFSYYSIGLIVAVTWLINAHS